MVNEDDILKRGKVFLFIFSDKVGVMVGNGFECLSR